MPDITSMRVITMPGLTWITLLLILISPISGQSFTSRSQNETARLGETVVIECAVSQQGSHTVEWWYVNHNLQISENSTILAGNKSHYTIIRPLGDTTGIHWNLQINHVTAQDGGHYKCALSDLPSKVQVSSLTVTDVQPPVRPTAVPDVDYTDCCRKLNVSSSCLPLCNPATVDRSTFKPEACSTYSDVSKLTQCGSDGRNHAPCCRRRMVPSSCLDFCLGGNVSMLAMSQLHCIISAEDIIQCYQEGQAILPSPPVRVTAKVITSSQVYVTWEKPMENGETVSNYIVFYKKAAEKGGYKSTLPVAASKTSVILQKLEAMTTYVLYVIAVNPHGSSAPSDMLKTTTSAESTPPPSNTNMMYCCRKNGVSATCQRALCAGSASPVVSSSEVYGCIGELGQAFTCLAGERNHSTCCRRKNLPDQCLDLCSGQLVTANFGHVQCLVAMADIMSCFKEGQDTIPGPPEDVHLGPGETTATSAVLYWSPPKADAPVTQYMVHIREKGKITYKQSLTTGTSMKLEPLKESTMYETFVTALNTNGTSLASSSIVFLTYSQTGVPTSPPGSETTRAPVTHNVKDCCVKEKVRPQCMSLCTYNLTVTATDSAQLVECALDLVKVLQCGADGSDHRPCCKKRGLRDICLPLCSYNGSEAELSMDHMACLYNVGDIALCLQEGINLIPGRPEQLYVVNMTTNTIKLSWQPPQRTAEGISHYLVEYMTEGSPAYININTNKTTYILQNLKPDTAYHIRVVSVNQHGTSLPSYGTKVRTLQVAVPVTTTPVPWPTVLPTDYPANTSDCCRKQNVSRLCMPACSGAVLQPLLCPNDTGKIFTCLTDARDHGPCCERRNVPKYCLGFCQGRPLVKDLSSLLCLMFLQPIFMCFREGLDTLPSPPGSFRVKSVGSRYVQMSWLPPLKNPDNVTYTLYYKQANSPSGIQAKVNATSPFKLTGLRPSSQYELYAVAVNKYGSSLPSPSYFIITNTEDPPEVQVEQTPVGVVSEKTTVILTCTGTGSPAPKLSWWRQGQMIHNGSTVRLENISSAQRGRYICMADNGNGRVQAHLDLRIIFKPTVEVPRGVIGIEPDKGLRALLQCNFYGNVSRVKWMNGMATLPSSGGSSNYKRYQQLTIDIPQNGIIESILKISNVRDEDYGNYTCVGSNMQGNVTGKIFLHNPAATKIPPAVPNVTACCLAAKVPPACMPACKFDLDLDALDRLPNKLLCVPSLGKILKCQSDGKNHSKCCSNKNVPDYCLDTCSGILNSNFVACLTYIKTMVGCMEEGHMVIPTPPQNVYGSAHSSAVSIHWEPPRNNSQYVTHYEIHYLEGATSMENVVRVGKNTLQYSVFDLRGDTAYTFFVVATNHHGSSLKSNVLQVTTGDIIPSPPQNFRGTVVDGVHVSLLWEMPKYNAGKVTKFQIYYKKASARSEEYVKVVVQGFNTRLDNLKEKTEYEMFITAATEKKESAPSNTVFIMTSAKPSSMGGKDRNRGGVSNDIQTGVAVGIALAVILIVILVAAVLFYYLRVYKKKRPVFQDTVAFENPGYTSAGEDRVQISGLPPDHVYSEPHQFLQPNNNHFPALTDPDQKSAVMNSVEPNPADIMLSPPPPPANGKANGLANGSAPKDDANYATLDVTELKTVDNTYAKIQQSPDST